MASNRKSSKTGVIMKNEIAGSTLSKELRKKYSTRSLTPRKDDSAKVMRGSYKGKTGKIERVNRLNSKVYITGIDKTKKDGSKALFPIHASNIMLTEIAPDKRRLNK